MLRKCLHCQCDFLPRKEGRDYCSRHVCSRAYRERTRAQHKSELKCVICGVAIVGKTAAAKYCGYFCKKKGDVKFRDREKAKAQRDKHRDHIKAYGNEYRAKNKEKLTAERREIRKSAGVLMYRRYYSAITRHKSYTGSLEEYVYYLERAGIQAHGNKKMAEARSEEYRKAIESNPTRGMTDGQAYKYWYDNDPTFRLWERQRNQFKKWMNGDRKSNSLARLVGYTREELLKHIEAQFDEGMSWENMGLWHVDHIIPKNLFDRTDAKQLKACWALDNLRPLWAHHNVRRPRDGSDVLPIMASH